jgi:hypothetical protein
MFGNGTGQTTGQGTVSTQSCQESGSGPATVLPTLQIASLSLSPTTLTSSGSVTLTVQMHLLGVVSGSHNVNVNVSTATTTPSGIGVHYDATTKVVTITNTTLSPVQEQFTITPGTSFNTGTVTIGASLTNSDGGIMILAPSGSNGQVTLNTTNP